MKRWLAGCAPILGLVANGALAASPEVGRPEAGGPAPVDCSAGRSEVPLPNPALVLGTNAPIDLEVVDTDVKEVYQAVGAKAGVRVLFDEQIRDKTFTFRVSGASFDQAMSQIETINQHYHLTLDEQTIIVIPDNLTKRRYYDELAIRTFYLCWADIDEVQQLLQRLIDTRFTSTVKALHAVTIRDTVDKVTMAGRLIASVDKPRAEVVLDLSLLGAGERRTAPIHVRVTDGEIASVEIDLDPRSDGRRAAVEVRVTALRGGAIKLATKAELTRPEGDKHASEGMLETVATLRDGETGELGSMGPWTIEITPHVLRSPEITQEDIAPFYVGTEENTVLRRP